MTGDAIPEKSEQHIDWYILLPVVGLMLFSIAFVYSASAYVAEIRFGSPEKFFLNHAMRVAGGLVLMIIFAKIDYHVWYKYSKPIIILAVIPLLLVFFVGAEYKGATRWIDIGPINFQPSEFAKWALVLHLATLLTKNRNEIKTFQGGLLPLLVWTFIVCVLIAAQPNFSTAFIIFIISLIMMFVGNTNLLHLGSIALFSLIGSGLYAIAAPYRLQRIYSFIGRILGNSDATNAHNYQAIQAIIAFGNGGIFGVGPGQSRQSNLFLPESYGDYIFSIIGEEYGFIGVTLIILIFIFIFWRGMLIAKKAPDIYGYFLAIGILSTFAIYAFVNTGVNVGILPATGVPLPFISYGGTAVFFYSAALGILLNISAKAGVYTLSGEK